MTQFWCSAKKTKSNFGEAGETAPPSGFVFLDAVPRTSVGKIKKIALREQFANWKWET